MYDLTNLSSKILIATANIPSSSMFAKSVVYIHQHSKNGAVGIIINQLQMDISTQTLLPANLAKLNMALDTPVYNGGPVSRDTLYLLYNTIDSSATQPKLHFTSTDLISHMSLPERINRYILVHGFSIWSNSQLEHEILNTHWIVSSCNHDFILGADIDNKHRLAFDHCGIKASNLILTDGDA